MKAKFRFILAAGVPGLPMTGPFDALRRARAPAKTEDPVPHRHMIPGETIHDC
ncbi:MAG: hypothetical protein Q8O52_06670 [Sulfuritalea sp.]|nr:hypothetical protein [Sulfuritalea sp.]